MLDDDFQGDDGEDVRGDPRSTITYADGDRYSKLAAIQLQASAALDEGASSCSSVVPIDAPVAAARPASVGESSTVCSSVMVIDEPPPSTSKNKKARRGSKRTLPSEPANVVYGGVTRVLLPVKPVAVRSGGAASSAAAAAGCASAGSDKRDGGQARSSRTMVNMPSTIRDEDVYKTAKEQGNWSLVPVEHHEEVPFLVSKKDWLPHGPYVDLLVHLQSSSVQESCPPTAAEKRMVTVTVDGASLRVEVDTRFVVRSLDGLRSVHGFGICRDADDPDTPTLHVLIRQRPEGDPSSSKRQKSSGSNTSLSASRQ